MGDKNSHEHDHENDETFTEWVKHKLNDMFVSSLPMDAIRVCAY